VTCERSSSFPALVDYFAGDVPAHEEAVLEDHWAGCRACADAASAVASLVAGATGLIAQGWGLWAVTSGMLERLRAQGLAIEERRAAPGDLLHLAETRGVDLLIARLAGDFAGLKSVDVEFDTFTGRIVEAGVPVTDDHELVIACVLHLRVPPGTRIRSRCTVKAADRILCEVSFAIDVSS
jgi:hypothetical protein